MNRKPKLNLNRRTISNLSNREMKFILGGDGDDENPSRKHCNTTGDDDDTEQILKEGVKIALSKLILVC